MENNLDLLLQAKKGDDSAKEKLVEQNLGLVWSVARRFTGRGYDIEDLFQIGCIGLIKSIDKFDFDYDVKFSTYAVPLIQGEIRRFLRDYGAIKVSRSLKEMNSKVEQYRQRVIKEKGYEPEIEEIAAALSYDAGEIVMAMEASLEPESLDAPIRAYIEERKLYIEITDYGCGIEDVEKAMEPMFTTGKDGRSGMGFSFMEAFMDELTVESEPGKGTTVKMAKKIGAGCAV